MKKMEKMIGAGLGLAAIAAASTYFLYGRNGNKNRKQIKGWMLKMKGEVLDEMENVKNMNQQTYNQLVDNIADRYGRLKNVSTNELKNVTDDIKKAWDHISQEVKNS